MPDVDILATMAETGYGPEIGEDAPRRRKFAVDNNGAGILHPIVERVAFQPFAAVERFQNFGQPFALLCGIGLGVRPVHLDGIAVLVGQWIEIGV